MKYFFIAIIAVFTFLSCSKTVLINVPYEGDKLVLTSLINQDSFIYARLSKSAPAGVNAPADIVPPGGSINLLENNIALGPMNTINVGGRTWFKSNIKAKANAIYSFVANGTNLTTATGTDKMPTKPFWKTLSYTNVTTSNINTGINENAKISLELKDNGSETNYYKLTVLRADTNLSPLGPRVKVSNQSYPYSFSAPELTNGGNGFLGDEESYYDLYFTDEAFNGRTVNISIRLNHYDPNTNPHVAPIITSLSKAYYLYITSLETAGNNNGNPFSEATNVFNNITNGYGIIGCQADSTLFIRKP